MAFTATGAVPTAIATTLWITTITPSDATARASGGASRRGRNTARYSTAPRSAVTSRETSAAGANPKVVPTSIDRGSPGRNSSISPLRSEA